MIDGEGLAGRVNFILLVIRGTHASISSSLTFLDALFIQGDTWFESCSEQRVTVGVFMAEYSGYRNVSKC